MSTASNRASSSTNSSLIRLAKAQDRAAWNELADLYGPMVYVWCRRTGLSPHAAADAVQETLVAALRSIERYENSQGGFRAWLWGIARHKIHDEFERQQRQPAAGGGTDFYLQLQQIPESLPEEGSSPQRDAALLIDRALGRVRVDFEERTWRAFELAVLQGESPAEVAVKLGMTAANVRQARCRILHRLRQLLDDVDLG